MDVGSFALEHGCSRLRWPPVSSALNPAARPEPCRAANAGLRFLRTHTTKHGMSISARSGAVCGRFTQERTSKVPDWFLWSLVLIGLILAALVILILRFLRDVDRHDRDD